jgi:hypothetical protein
MKNAILLILLLFVTSSIFSQNVCEECDKFKIVGVYDFGPPPGGNWIILLLTVTEDLDGGFDPHYSSMYFVNDDQDTITIPLGPSHTLPSKMTDTIPFMMELSLTLRNQDFPKDFKGNLIIRTPTGGSCGTVAYCHLKFTLLSTSMENWISNSNDILLFPNPVRDILNLASAVNIEQILVFNNQGKVLLSFEDERNRIDLSSLQAGTYYVMTRDDNGWHTWAPFVKID